LVIYCAIRSLIVGGHALWKRFDNGDNLLFTQQDLQDPANSLLFSELMRLDDPEVRRVADHLRRAAYLPLKEPPLLEGEHFGSLWQTAPPPVRLPVKLPDKANEMRPREIGGAVFSDIPQIRPIAVSPTFSRGILKHTLIGAAAVLFCCIGVGTLILLGYGGK